MVTTHATLQTLTTFGREHTALKSLEVEAELCHYHMSCVIIRGRPRQSSASWQRYVRHSERRIEGCRCFFAKEGPATTKPSLRRYNDTSTTRRTTAAVDAQQWTLSKPSIPQRNPRLTQSHYG
ncbi:unnamed protein product [Ectocarpus sp. 4 AP-2014]